MLHFYFFQRKKMNEILEVQNKGGGSERMKYVS